MIKKYNDNELLYLISENDEHAFELLCEKYHPLIVNRLRRFKIHGKNFEDYYQECLMILNKCAKNYREDKCFTFNIYLDISIQNMIKNMLRKEKKYFYDVYLLDVEKIDLIKFKEKDLSFNENDEIKNIHNKFEKEVMELYLKGKSIKSIAKDFDVKSNKIYYIINKYKPKKKEKTINMWGGVFSDLEKQVYDLYVLNYRPAEISRFLNCEVSIVYNAIKRIKLKSK